MYGVIVTDTDDATSQATKTILAAGYIVNSMDSIS